MAADGDGYRSVNPLFMKYTSSNGRFAGQLGYGYRSIEAFIDAVSAIRRGEAGPADFDDRLATAATTFRTTAVLEAGRVSLDNGGLPVQIVYEDAMDDCMPTSLKVT